MNRPGNDSLRVELSAATLTRLLAGGHLGAAELRCLDCASKTCLRRLCLASCIRPLSGCAGCPYNASGKA